MLNLQLKGSAAEIERCQMFGDPFSEIDFDKFSVQELNQTQQTSEVVKKVENGRHEETLGQ